MYYAVFCPAPLSHTVLVSSQKSKKCFGGPTVFDSSETHLAHR